MSSLDLLLVDHILPTDTCIELTPKTANKLLRLGGELLTTDVLMTRSVPGNVRSLWLGLALHILESQNHIIW